MTRGASLLLAAWLLSGSGATAQSGRPGGNPDRGMFLFGTYCTACHGDEGKGDGPMAPRLARDFRAVSPDLSSSAWQKSVSDATLRKVIRNGGKAVHRSQFMPAWGLTLTDGQVEDLLVYIRDFKTPNRNPKVSIFNVQDRLELGRTLYSLYCAACHGRTGQGDGPLIEAAQAQGHLEKPPPDFTAPNFYRNRTDEDIHRMAESGPAHARIGLNPAESSWWHRPLSPSELDSLTLYLRAQALVSRKK